MEVITYINKNDFMESYISPLIGGVKVKYIYTNGIFSDNTIMFRKRSKLNIFLLPIYIGNYLHIKKKNNVI